MAQGFGATFCTTINSDDTDCSDGTCWFQSALDAAENNGEDDVIKVVEGTYNFETDKSFKYDASEGKDITLKGGYDAACQSQTLDPANTVINGDASDYYHTTLIITQKAGGNVYVEGLTIQNGGGHEGAGLEISTKVTVADQSADVTVKKNIIKNSVRPNSDGTGPNKAQPGGLKVSANDFTDSGFVTGKIAIEDNVVTGNSADNNYAAIYASTQSANQGTASEISVLNNTVTGNNGTGIRLETTTESGTAKGITVKGNDIAQNTCTATSCIGGVKITVNPGEGTGEDIRVENNTIIGNSAYSGGGVRIVAPASSTSGRNGAGVYLINNIIAENEVLTAVGTGGGVSIYASNDTYAGSEGNRVLVNNTISGNKGVPIESSGHVGHGIYLDTRADSVYHIYNNIIWGNGEGEDGEDIYMPGSGGTVYFKNNDYGTLAQVNEDDNTIDSGNNISENPNFASITGDTPYRLSTNSPCIDTGDNEAPDTPTRDIDGEDRPADGDESGTATVDIGADEYGSEVTTPDIQCDFDKDGQITLKDIIYWLQALAGIR